jgi:monofunctional biosynthetic peptidoglycan transglycosylase
LAAVLPSPAKRDARAPGPGLRRLAELYVARSARAAEAANCVRPTR